MTSFMFFTGLEIVLWTCGHFSNKNGHTFNNECLLFGDNVENLFSMLVLLETCWE